MVMWLVLAQVGKAVEALPKGSQTFKFCARAWLACLRQLLKYLSSN